MARSNRPRRENSRRRQSKRNQEWQPLDVERLQGGMRRTEFKRGREYTVQPIRAERAQKVYTCPGCSGDIMPGTAHIAAWQADHIMGDASALADRRHWHSHCWKIA
ncbi:hypothetical protein [Gulosibacter sp. 10]|uniref:hypothetical protein n=1 Tax=Gulosibacter sp. 10 TaxID=1255570 RepID=UPI00097F0C4A|nr:hypothetical protein [Gulosibacter sp. 10]SJM52179.1 Putative ATP/GTP-binding protein, doubtful CDS [Gulosibacter sp. 10]HCA16739.1 hypothetical protein [Alcaligenes faecalis]